MRARKEKKEQDQRPRVSRGNCPVRQKGARQPKSKKRKGVVKKKKARGGVEAKGADKGGCLNRRAEGEGNSKRGGKIE